MLKHPEPEDDAPFCPHGAEEDDEIYVGDKTWCWGMTWCKKCGGWRW